MKNKKYMLLNLYECPLCNYSWEDEYECAVNDDCPNCGNRHIEPYESEII
jgi:rubrerythrin|tara:strand:+ start:611 stop:760 length:150 start_codon:yes stop_codon:yes gene_type:complete